MMVGENSEIGIICRNFEVSGWERLIARVPNDMILYLFILVDSTESSFYIDFLPSAIWGSFISGSFTDLCLWVFGAC